MLLCVHQVSCALELIEGLRTEANAERGLPRLAVSFALDCRGRFACKPLREWLVRHLEMVYPAKHPLTGLHMPVVATINGPVQAQKKERKIQRMRHGMRCPSRCKREPE